MILSLNKENTHLRINTHGAKINELYLNRRLILGTFERGNGKPGVTHPCSPIFGPETTTHYGLTQHGPVRDSEWEVGEQTASEVTLSCAIHQGTYPDGVAISQTFRLSSNSLTIETKHVNQGQTAVPIQFAEHCYWNAPEGWEEAKLNDSTLASLIRTTGSMPLEGHNRLVIPGQPEIRIVQTSLPVAVLWTYHDERSNQWDHNYFCLEPCEAPVKSDFFGSSASLLTPGLTKEHLLTIAL